MHRKPALPGIRAILAIGALLALLATPARADETAAPVPFGPG